MPRAPEPDDAPPREGWAWEWRALFSLLWSASPGRLVLYVVLVLAVGILPTAVILATGALVRAVPAVLGQGTGGAEMDAALTALAVMVAALTALAVGGNVLTQLCRVLDAAFALEVHHAVARVAVATPGTARFDDPEFADRLQAVQEAEREGVLARTTAELASVAAMRLRGAGALVVLAAFQYWAPLALAAAWPLTNRVHLRTARKGVAVAAGEGGARLRWAEYLRSLAVEPAGAKEMRVFGLGGWSVAEYGTAWRGALEVMWRSRSEGRGLKVVATLALVAAHGAVLGALAVAAVRGRVDVAALLVFAQAVLATSDLGIVGDPQWWLARSLSVAGQVARLRASAPPPRGSGALTTSGSGAVAVDLRDVRFTYRGRERPALDGLTLSIPPGQSLAVVGENGSGKSTLIKLLCGVYQPEAGSVAVDGGAPRQARGRLGVIFQDFVRFKLPLRENVGFGHLPLLDDAPVLEGALADAGAGALLARLPAGWDTVLSREFEGGEDLSGGEWQRVALARALAAVRGGAGLLILDEPTASLDVRAETELFERFLALTRGVTTVLVSHRLSSVRRADRIVVIDGGKVVEDGTHAELMRRGGRYAEMYSLQARRFAEAGTDGEEAAHG